MCDGWDVSQENLCLLQVDATKMNRVNVFQLFQLLHKNNNDDNNVWA